MVPRSPLRLEGWAGPIPEKEFEFNSQCKGASAQKTSWPVPCVPQAWLTVTIFPGGPEKPHLAAGEEDAGLLRPQNSGLVYPSLRNKENSLLAQARKRRGAGSVFGASEPNRKGKERVRLAHLSKSRAFPGILALTGESEPGTKVRRGRGSQRAVR